MEMWTYLGFEPWEHRGTAKDSTVGFLKGVTRKITLVKSSVVGIIAKYYVWDYVIWSHQNAAEYLTGEWKPMPDVMTQRFLLVGSPSPKRKIKGYWLGFRGFLEIYSYIPGGDYHAQIKDLIPPVDLAWKADETPKNEARSL
jgi:hypothetical protein